MDDSCRRGPAASSRFRQLQYDASKSRVRLKDLPATGAQRDAKEMHLPGAPVQDRRIGDAAEVRGHSRSETRRAAAAGGAARIAPVVHPTRVVARENVLCSEVQYRAVEFVRRADGYAARPVPRREGRCAIEDSCSLPEFAAIISDVELVREVIVKRRRLGIRRTVVDQVEHARPGARKAARPVGRRRSPRPGANWMLCLFLSGPVLSLLLKSSFLTNRWSRPVIGSHFGQIQ